MDDPKTRVHFIGRLTRVMPTYPSRRSRSRVLSRRDYTLWVYCILIAYYARAADICL